MSGWLVVTANVALRAPQPLGWRAVCHVEVIATSLNWFRTRMSAARCRYRYNYLRETARIGSHGGREPRGEQDWVQALYSGVREIPNDYGDMAWLAKRSLEEFYQQIVDVLWDEMFSALAVLGFAEK